MRILSKKIVLSTFFLFVFGAIGFVFQFQTVEAQNKPLTYPEIITALNTKLPNKAFKNKTGLITWLIKQIEQRGVDKPLTTDREDDLRQAGATDAVIIAIRENSSQSSDSNPPLVPQKNLRTISGGVLNGKAVSLVKPPYPAAAKVVRASGAVNVQVTIDENGNVISASAVSGHALLRQAAETAARASKFSPTMLSGQKVRVTGIIIYNFSTGNDSVSNTNSNVYGIEFIRIPNGSFMMGSPTTEEYHLENEVLHKVTINNKYEFWMGKYEVTQEQWTAVMGTNPSHFMDCPKCPVEQVSWNDIQLFIKKLNEDGIGTYRLPTEAEWEYAARAGTTTAFAFGEALTTNQANFFVEDGAYEGKTMPVGSYQPNPWGLYDMHGNINEWVQDWKGTFTFGSSQINPMGPTSGSEKVIKGGGYAVQDYCLRSAIRYSDIPTKRDKVTGFRLVWIMDKIKV